jgi:altronate hydrolase
MGLFPHCETKLPATLQIHPSDNVLVALQPVVKGQSLDGGLTAASDVPFGHKIALRTIAPGEPVIKYGYSIGVAKCAIAPGAHVHSHNVASALAASLQRGGFKASGATATPGGKDATRTFDGFRRPDGSVGIRNEIWIVNTVGCVNQTAARIAEAARQRLAGKYPTLDGIYTMSHPFGCSQLGADLTATQKLLAALARHPNAGGVLVLGLGCENNQLQPFLETLGETTPGRLRSFNAQDVEDEVEYGVQMICELAEYASQFKREPVPVSELIVGMKCGGSDGLSGITANPLVGRIADKLAAAGGTAILTEVPEMFGAEDVLLRRACAAEVYDATIDLVNDFREYFRKHNEPIDENPSPGNKEGGITTLAEKSLGCVQKGGTAPVAQVLKYGDKAQPGLGAIALLNGPGNDGVSGSALSGAGAHMVLFTTGRGNPMGFPAPTVKVATNTPLAERKSNWIDFNAGPVADGTATIDELADKLFDLIVDIASGRSRTRSEINGYREISIWKDGVTL